MASATEELNLKLYLILIKFEMAILAAYWTIQI